MPLYWSANAILGQTDMSDMLAVADLLSICTVEVPSAPRLAMPSGLSDKKVRVIDARLAGRRWDGRQARAGAAWHLSCRDVTSC